jgi:hypothetical protein
VEKYHRSAAPTVQTINVFGAMEPRDSGHYGTYVTATIAAAPFPIPITFKGHFQSYRLGAGAGAARRGFLARLFDFLTGCGRR